MPESAAIPEHRIALSPAEAAERLGVSRRSMYRAIECGDIPTVRLGARILVPVVALERFVETGAA